MSQAEQIVVTRRTKAVPAMRVRRCRAGGRHQVGWCFGLCTPVNGYGLCGRQAPHALHGRTLLAMKAAKEAAESGEELD
jgi:hypothetical protein